MSRRILLTAIGFLVVGIAAWLGHAGPTAETTPTWTEVAPGLHRVLASNGKDADFLPAGYALLDGDRAILFDVPHDVVGLKKLGVTKIDAVYLTSYHRDRVAGLKTLWNDAPFHAPEKADEWLAPDKVAKYWRDSIPLRSSRTAYQVVPTGIASIDYSLKDGRAIAWRGFSIQVVDLPGHARAHVGFVVRRGNAGPRSLISGGAIASAGKMFSPFTTDWDHWTDVGLKPTAASLEKMLSLNADLVCPSHGPVLKTPADAIRKTLAHVQEIGFLKSFERFTKTRVGDAPQYPFLAKEQAESNGSKPWSKVSEHLYLTGNTYVLVSKEGGCLMVDPWDKRSFDQFEKLRKERNLGPVEVVMFSHAHFDHYDGVHFFDRSKLQVWSLDEVAGPLADPFFLRAPFLDARPITFDKRPKPGETLTWREYAFRFHHLPGQSVFTMAVETKIDGKRCLFTADNFFHQDMFSGSGGWMGLNRSFPPLYAESAKKVLDINPEWVLAEHGGPFEFSAEDFRRREQWGRVSAAAADALSLSGHHQHDWNPHRVRVEPFMQKVKPGAVVKASLVIDNLFHGQAIANARIVLDGRGVFPDRVFTPKLMANATSRETFEIRVPTTLAVGRHIFALRVEAGANLDGADAVMALDVE